MTPIQVIHSNVSRNWFIYDFYLILYYSPIFEINITYLDIYYVTFHSTYAYNHTDSTVPCLTEFIM